MSEEKYFNPLTKRWIKKDGKTYKKLMQTNQINDKPAKVKSPQKEKTKEVRAYDDLPADVIREIAKYVSQNTLRNMSNLNKHFNKELKEIKLKNINVDHLSLTPYGKQNAIYLLKFIQNLDNYIARPSKLQFLPNMNKKDKNVFTRSLFAMFKSILKPKDRLNLSIELKIYQENNINYVVLLLSDDRRRKGRKKTFLSCYELTDSLNLKFIENVFEDPIMGDILNDVSSITTNGKKPELNEIRVGRKIFYEYEYLPPSQDNMLKEWYDLVYNTQAAKDKIIIEEAKRAR